MLHFRNFSNNKSFKNAEEEYSKLQKKFLSSNQSLEAMISSKLIKKEIVTNKEYEKAIT